MATDNPRQRFLRSLVASQPRLYAYVVSLLHDPERAYDVLQQANVVMLDKADEFSDQGKPFLPWAFKVCYYEVLSERRDRGRCRHVFDDDFLETIADMAAALLVTAWPTQSFEADIAEFGIAGASSLALRCVQCL